MNTKQYTVPSNHYFLLGDNRLLKTYRYLKDVGYVNQLNLVGRAKIYSFQRYHKRSFI